MQICKLLAASALLLAGCGQETVPDDANIAVGPDQPATRIVRSADKAPTGGWNMQSAGEGVALAYMKSGTAAVRLICPAGARELVVNVPAFRPIGSEERLSFGSGGNVVALVADTHGDRQRGGVSGTGTMPENLAVLIGGPIAASYGSQNSGPHVAPSPALGRAFVAACRKDPARSPRPAQGADQISACLIQDGKRLQNPALRAVGTEPFWGATIEGRCVTYSHPEDLSGTRVWTRFTPGPNDGGTWSGALGGRPFELTVRHEQGCSDGMSDNRYPFAVDVAVNGERQRGCAERR